MPALPQPIERASLLRPGGIPDLLRTDRPAMDLARVERATDYRAKKTGPGTYWIHTEDARGYHVLLYPYFDCECGDATLGGSLCKHIVRALIEVGDPDAMQAMEGVRLLRELGMGGSEDG